MINEHQDTMEGKSKGIQVKTGKAFEYAVAYQYYQFLLSKGINVELVANDPLQVAKGFFDEFSQKEQRRYEISAYQTIDTMTKLEPGLVLQRNKKDCLYIMLNDDLAGRTGDVRDIILRRTSPSWEIGFSAKNNHEAVKHSRLSNTNDFGDSWIGIPCSETYWNEITPIFDYVGEMKDKGYSWESLGKDKVSRVYVPLLDAFKKELLRMYGEDNTVPERLVKYLVGEYPFYKIIKNDAHNLVVVKAFNIAGGFNKTVGGLKARYKVPQLPLPTRIVEFDYKKKVGEKDTLDMILDCGWEISFRIHSADKPMPKSLKFDIQLLGNPPILFTQHLFQDE